MSHPYYHARSAAQRWGYWPIEHWFDSSKSYCIDPRHRIWMSQGAKALSRQFAEALG